MTTPQGTGEPTNLWPDTEMEPMGFLKVTMGARLTKGICGGRAGVQVGEQLGGSKYEAEKRSACGAAAATARQLPGCTAHNCCLGTQQTPSGRPAAQRTIMPNSAPSQWMKKRSSV